VENDSASSTLENREEASGTQSEDLGDRGLFVTFLLVFFGGLALNLTPCVYPMIPITITYFGGQAQGKKGSIFLHAFLYVIGMAVTYSILGVAAAMTGSLFGAAYQYPPVLIGFALIMVLLALSMFDVYELRVPASLNRLASGSQKGFVGTVLMGLTVGIIAAPCIGPFVLGLLSYVGNKGNAFLGFALFFVLALGLGVPFLVLGIFSGSIHRLPRSGAWMVWVRKIFGFILLAMAVYFLETLFPNLLAYHLALALIMLLAGIYLAWIDPVQVSGKAFPYIRNAVGILFFGAALYVAVTGLHAGVGIIQTGQVGQNPGDSIEWQPYSDLLLDQASKDGKPVLIDFYADWCAPCKELDRHTFTAPEVIDRSKGFYMIKVDLTTSGDAQAEALREQYDVKGVPILVFLGPDGQEIDELRVSSFEPPDVFLKKMNRALQLGETGQF
jgi:thiol:disulfide interchange protein DsbD